MFFDTLPKPFVIAEISGNHLGKLDRALQLIEAAKNAGASAVKFQHYSPDTITVKSSHPDFLISGESLWNGRYLWDLYSEAATPWEWTESLVGKALELGIPWFSSPFDESAVDFLEQFAPPMYKVASFEIVDHPLIERIAAARKPMIISTGMALEAEIDEAINVALEGGAPDLALLRTNSAYPAPVREMDLAAIPYMAGKWRLPVGLSDHSTSNTPAVVAAALGATIFEKHLTLDRGDGGPDAAFSLEPMEFAEYVSALENASLSIGSHRLAPSRKEAESLKLRPSIRALRDIGIGERLTLQNVGTVRPSGGLHPRHLGEVIGRVAVVSVSAGDPISWDEIGE